MANSLTTNQANSIRGTVLFRADGSSRIGTGHLARCSTLAAAMVERGVSVHLASRGMDLLPAWLINLFPGTLHELPAATQRLAPGEASDMPHASWLESTQEEDADQTADVANVIRPEWIVVDHYGIDAMWHRAMASSTGALMAIDDLGDRAIDVDLLLDQNRDETMVRESYGSRLNARTRILGGPSWAILRSEFARSRALNLASKNGNRIVVMIGGLGSADVVAQVLEGLASIQQPLVVDVIHGDPSTAGAMQEIGMSCSLDVTVHVSPSNVSEIMAKACLAVSTAGGTAWELACLGIPSILLPIADNQAVVGNRAVEAGFAMRPDRLHSQEIGDLAGTLLGDPRKRFAMSHAGRSFVDGLGANRVVSTMFGQ